MRVGRRRPRTSAAGPARQKGARPKPGVLPDSAPAVTPATLGGIPLCIPDAALLTGCAPGLVVHGFKLSAVICARAVPSSGRGPTPPAARARTAVPRWSCGVLLCRLQAAATRVMDSGSFPRGISK